MAEQAEPNPIVFFDITLGGKSHHHYQLSALALN
jgi:hypothetical protein